MGRRLSGTIGNDPNSDLTRLLESCTVTLSCGGKEGTGFFVGPGLALTCAHVVNRAAEGKELAIGWGRKQYTGSLVQMFPTPYPTAGDVFPDVALVKVEIAEHPCVLLDSEFQARDPLYSFGYSGERPGGESLTGDCEGSANYQRANPDAELIKFKDTQVLPGISGSPLLNQRTGAVCGIVKRTRGDGSPMGGTAVRIARVFELLPELEKQNRDFHSQSDSWGKAASRKRPPFMAPNQPTGFVNRAVEEGRLLEAVIDPQAHSAKAGTVAVYGAGGFGKTTLAAALCHQQAVGAAFDDGILWVTLGERPDVLAALERICQVIQGQPLGASDIEVGSIRLAEILADSTCLLVIDDVWNELHVRPFLRGAPRCLRLVTTRQFDIAVNLGGVAINVDEMTSDEAISMLTSWLTPRPVLEPFRKLAAQLGEWPLLLELARDNLRQRLARGDKVEDGVAYLCKAYEAQGMVAFDRNNPAERNQAAAQSLQVSLELLTVEERTRYQQLAIFSAEVDVPLTSVCAPWGLDSFKTEKLVEHLADLSLLRYELSSNSIRLHDVIRSWLASQLGDPSTLHGRLIDGWGDPHKLPDAYAWRWIAYHLAAAGRVGVLRTLLLDPEWIEAKLRATSPNALSDDYAAVPSDTDLAAIQKAIRLSTHVLARDPAELQGQLMGRLRAFDSPVIGEFLDRLASSPRKPWLRPASACLTPPGSPLIRVIEGHQGHIRSVAVTPDGRRLISAADDKTVRVWDLETGATVRILNGHAEAVKAVALTADGHRIVSCSYDHTLKIWDLETGVELRTLTGHQDAVTGVALTPDGRFAISSSRDKTLKVWDLETGADLRTLQGHQAAVNGVAVSFDGRIAISASDDKTLKLWNIESSADLGTLEGHADGVNAVAVTPDDKYVISASNDGMVGIWDVGTGDSYGLTGHQMFVLSVAVTPDGKRIVSSGLDGTVRVWDLQTRTAVRVLKAQAVFVFAVAVTPNGRRIISGGFDDTIKVWDPEANAAPEMSEKHKQWVNEVAVNGDGRRAVSASYDHTARVWDLKTGTTLITFAGHGESVNAVALTPDGRCAITGSADKTLKLWDLDSGAVIRTFEGHTNEVRAVAVTPDGRRAISGAQDNTLKIWDLAAETALRTLEGHTDDVTRVAVTSDGRRAVSGSLDRSLKVWDLETGAELRTLLGHTFWIEGLALTPCGRYALSVSHHTTLIWDLETGMALNNPGGVDGSWRPVAVSPDGRRFVLGAGGARNTLDVWDFQRLEILMSFTGDANAYTCAWTPDGATIVVGDGDGRVYCLDIEEP
jgi:WD40 repeat protein